MAILLPGASASLASEYAATSINYNFPVQPDASGFLVPSCVAQINYQRTDYLVDAKGNRTNVVQRNLPSTVQPGPDPYSGWISIPNADFVLLSAPGEVDKLIHADLVARKILEA